MTAGVPLPRRRRRAAAAGALAAAAALAGLVLFARTRPGAEVRRDAGLSVLLVSIDTLRADAVGAYGRRDAGTYWIDRLAQGGVRFERAYAHNVVTLPSHANLLAGRHPYEHGIRDNSGFRFPPDMPTLATLLRAAGYRTGAFVSAFPLDSRFGLDAGFDVYDDRLGGGEVRSSVEIAERAAPATVAEAARWLAAQGGRRTFTFVHLYEPHFPYQPPAPFAERYAAAPYQGEVAAADAALEPLLRPLLEAGGARTLVVVTSDHGEALGDHGELSHGVFAYEATLRVPLVLYAPGVLPAATVKDVARHVDLLPTVLDALGIAAPAGLPGRSLLPAAARPSAAAEGPRLYFEALTAHLNQGWAPLYGVLEGTLKYVDLPIPELYDLAADPAEARNLAAARPAEMERLRRALAVFRAGERGVAREVAETAEVRERLRALGYASGAAAPRGRATEADDPKRLIVLERRSAEALRLLTEGDAEGAARAWREVLRARPDSALVHLQLAYAERARGDLGAAVGAARRAAGLRPEDGETVALLATYLIEAGRPAEALAAVAAFPDEPDLDVLTARAMALAALGRREEGLAALERARAADPSNAMVLANVGTVRLMAGEHALARSAFQSALALDPGLSRAHNGLGVVAAREGDAEEAVEHWRRAAELDPRDYQALYNVGTTLVRLGRGAAARPYLEAYVQVAPRAREERDIQAVRAWLERGGALAAPPR